MRERSTKPHSAFSSIWRSILWLAIRVPRRIQSSGSGWKDPFASLEQRSQTTVKAGFSESVSSEVRGFIFSSHPWLGLNLYTSFRLSQICLRCFPGQPTIYWIGSTLWWIQTLRNWTSRSCGSLYWSNRSYGRSQFHPHGGYYLRTTNYSNRSICRHSNRYSNTSFRT